MEDLWIKEAVGTPYSFEILKEKSAYPLNFDVI
jgi:hypothetical protein